MICIKPEVPEIKPEVLEPRIDEKLLPPTSSSLRPPPSRLIGKHYATQIPAPPTSKRAHLKRDCVACNVRKSERDGYKRKSSTWQCKKCGVALCMPVCFEVYHEVADYKAIVGNRGNPVIQSPPFASIPFPQNCDRSSLC